MTKRDISFSTAIWSLLGAFSLALALPLLGTLGSGPTFFVAHDAAGLDIIFFALTVYLLPVLVVAAVLVLLGARRGSTASAVGLSLAITLALGVWLLSVLKGLSPAMALGGALLIAAGAGWWFYRDGPVRSLLVIVGQISVLIPLYFLFFTPVKTLLGSADEVAGAAGSGGANTPVVVLILDEMPTAALMDETGEIDAVRFPGFARLQSMSIWYRHATTVSTNTHLAISAIHSGRRSDASTLPIPGQLPQNIFTLLAPTHRVFAIESVSRLCSPTLCESEGDDAAQRVFDLGAFYRDVRVVWLHTVLPQQVADERLPSIIGKWRDFAQGDAAVQEAALGNINTAMTDGFDAKHRAQWDSFIARMDETGAVLNYLHIGLPHHPWIYLPDGTVYNGRETPATTYTHDWRAMPALVGQASLRFAMQMEYVDSLIVEMLDALEQSGRLEETMLLVLSDHGLAIAPKARRRTPEVETLADVAAVPLFIKFPGQREAVIDDRVVETIDILPTLASALDIALFDRVEGQVLNSDSWVETPRQVFGATPEVAAAELDFEASVNRFRRWLKPGQTSLGSWSRASGGPYLGRDVSGAPAARQSLSFAMDRPEWYAQVQPDSGFLPARLTGTLAGAKRGTPVYAALNGVIAGGSAVNNPKGALSIMLDPAAFRPGANRVEVFVLESGTLARVASSESTGGRQWVVERNGAVGLRLVDAKGRAYEADPGKSGSAIISRDAPLAAVVGTAFDPVNKVTPAALLLTDGSRIITDNFRAYLGRTADNPMAETLVSAFTVEITTGSVSAGAALQVLAVWDDGTFLSIPVTDNTALFQ